MNDDVGEMSETSGVSEPPQEVNESPTADAPRGTPVQLSLFE